MKSESLSRLPLDMSSASLTPLPGEALPATTAAGKAAMQADSPADAAQSASRPLVVQRAPESLLSMPEDIQCHIMDQLQMLSPFNGAAPQFSALARSSKAMNKAVSLHLSRPGLEQIQDELTWRKQDHLDRKQKEEQKALDDRRTGEAGEQLLALLDPNSFINFFRSPHDDVRKFSKAHPVVRLDLKATPAKLAGKAVCLASRERRFKEVKLVATGLKKGEFSRRIFPLLGEQLDTSPGVFVSLDLSGSEFDKEDSRLLRALLMKKWCLQGLNLSGITPESKGYMAQVPMLPLFGECNLVRLDLSDNKWLRECSWPLQVGGFKFLEELSLARCDINLAAGRVHVARLGVFAEKIADSEGFRSLNLDDNGLSDKDLHDNCLKHMVPRCRMLEKVSLRCNRLTAAYMAGCEKHKQPVGKTLALEFDFSNQEPLPENGKSRPDHVETDFWSSHG